MRQIVSGIGAATALLAASTATAATTYTAAASVASGNSLSALVPGDIVTIDITMRTDDELTIAVSASAIGYDAAVARYASGTSVGSVLAQACIAAFGCIGALDNYGSVYPTESLANPLGPEVQFVNAYTTSAAGGDGSSDLGVNGVAGGPQFRLVFTANGRGSTTITLGSDTRYGDATIGSSGAILVTNGASVALTVIPEPQTALLVGLGLAHLAATRRRA